MIVTVHETCPCGATFDTTAAFGSLARRASEEWRAQHKHAESVGICGDQFKPPILGDEGLTCNLKAGHAGWHNEGQTHWKDGESS